MWRGIAIESEKADVVSLVQDERQRRFSTATEADVVPPARVFRRDRFAVQSYVSFEATAHFGFAASSPPNPFLILKIALGRTP